LKIPSFPGIGEGELWSLRPFGVARAKRQLSAATGFIAVSSYLKELVADVLDIPRDHFGVFPNAVDTRRFRPIDRIQARRKLGLPEDMFVVGSAGNFLEKKGVARVARAIDGLSGVVGAYAGSGPVPPQGDNVALCRRVSHEDMPSFFSACDVFALPTVVEGSSNVLMEAMACGVPIISSEGRFNDDILNNDVAVRIDPMNIDALRSSVVDLRRDPARRLTMARAAIDWSHRMNADVRAEKIIKFMECRLSGRWPGV